MQQPEKISLKFGKCDIAFLCRRFLVSSFTKCVGKLNIKCS